MVAKTIGTLDPVGSLSDATEYAVEQGTSFKATHTQLKTYLTTNGFIDSGVPFTSADETKLDGIETGATADQSDAEIKTAYENNADTNAFTDADETKLDGIATGAIANVVEDTTPQLGGDLDANGNNIQFDHNTGIQDSNGNEIVGFRTIASAVNYFEMQGAVTAGAVRMSSAGSDANVNMIFDAKGGTSLFLLRTNGTTRATVSSTGVTVSSGHDLTITSGDIILGTGGPIIAVGSGSPESAVTADVGSTFHRTDGGAGTSFYVKESGTGNTGWVAK